MSFSMDRQCPHELAPKICRYRRLAAPAVIHSLPPNQNIWNILAALRPQMNWSTGQQGIRGQKRPERESQLAQANANSSLKVSSMTRSNNVQPHDVAGRSTIAPYLRLLPQSYIRGSACVPTPFCLRSVVSLTIYYCYILPVCLDHRPSLPRENDSLLHL